MRAYAFICVVLGVFPAANWLTGGAAVPWYGAAVVDWLARGTVVSLVAVVAAALLGARVETGWNRLRALLLAAPSGAFAAAAAVVAATAAAVISQWSFAGLPFTSDEMAQQWHARVIASGHLAAVPEQHAEFFNTAPIHDRDGRWFSQYPVGGPALIAAGVLAGAPWLVNPLLIGVATWMLYRFLAEAFDEPMARGATLLWIASPMVLVMAASQMNHVPALAFTLIALRALAAWDRAGDQRARALAAAGIGLATGLVILVRPLDGVVLALAMGVFQLWRCVSDRSRVASLAAQAAVAMVPVALLLWANVRTTGSPMLFAYEALNGPEHALGFHVDPNGEMHSPRRGLAYVSGYLMRLSRYLFEWPLPGMLVVAAGLALVKRATRWDVLLAAFSAAVLMAYGAYWFDGFFAGPRFLFVALPAFVYFAARAPGAAAAVLERPLGRRAVLLLVPFCVAVSWLVPYGLSGSSLRVSMYRAQRTKLKTDVDAQLERAGLGNALVFVNESWRGRLLARLRVLGVSQFRAERIVSTTDACALHTALDAEDSVATSNRRERADRVIATARAFGEARRVPGLDADQVIALVPGSTPTPACFDEYRRDQEGTIPYAIFLARQEIGRDGRVGGDVVFARDLGARNELLRGRFANRAWYRYRTPASLEDTLPVFLPYDASRSASGR